MIIYYFCLLFFAVNCTYGQEVYNHYANHPHYPPLVTVDNANGINNEDGKHVGVHIP
jgi:hypothetical protein